MIVGRLVESPVFVISGERSGSALLRRLLDSHTRIRAPRALDLTGLRVVLGSRYVELAMDAAGLDGQALEYILWDRILHDVLVASGKDLIVVSEPQNALVWRRTAACWPKARFVFLLREPADIVVSAIRTQPASAGGETVEIALELIYGMKEALMSLPGHQVEYENLVVDPGGTVSALCGFLELPYEPGMLTAQGAGRA